MKCVYKIGRLYLISDQLFHSFELFRLENLEYDNTTESFFDLQGNIAEKPTDFHINNNVFFLEISSEPFDFACGVKVSSEKGITVWKIEADWVYASNDVQGCIRISPDYVHATYYVGEWDLDRKAVIVPQPIMMAIQCRMLKLGYLIFHASCIEVNGRAVLFSAPSGVGKSTRANRWIEACGASFISGDRPVIDPVRRTALGAPWDGMEAVYRNIEVPILAFNCIQRAEKTKFTRLTEAEKKSLLVKQAFVPMWDPALVAKVFSGIQKLIKGLQIWNMACDQTLVAARECYNILFPKEPKNVIELLGQLKATDTPKDEYKAAIDSFMEFKARKLGIPFCGTFELTPLCNLDCKMCYVHLYKSQMQSKKLLSTTQWKSLMKEAHDAGMQMAKLTGGECLTYPGFDELYLYLQELGVGINVLTNGLLLNEKRIQFFKEHPVRQIQVTLYGSSEEAYERVTGVRSFAQVYTNLMNAKAAGLPISLAVTPSTFAYPDILQVIQLAENMEIPYKINSLLFKPRENTEREIHDLSIEQYLEIYRQQAKVHSTLLQPVDPAELPDVSTSGKVEKGIKCGAGRSSFTISWEGKLLPCLNLTYTHEEPMEIGFIEAWKKINSWAKELPVPSECNSCPYHAQCLQCIAVHHDPEQPGHCNKAICERTKAFTEAGLYYL